MTMWHQDRPLTVSARPAGTYWLDGAESDCPWCCELGSFFPAGGTAPDTTPRTEPATPLVSSVPPVAVAGVASRPPALTQVHGWIERTRVVMVPVAVITVLAALTLVVAG